MKEFSPILQQESHKNWQHFKEQHGYYAQVLSGCALADFKKAITLSDFVCHSAMQAPDIVVDLFTSQSVYQLDMPAYQELLTAMLVDCQDEPQLYQIVRRFRLQQMVMIAVADLVLDIPLDSSLARLSLLAEVMVLTTLDWLTKLCQKQWGVPRNSAGEIQPLLVYGMGKLGGRELNFSSDIDLIFLYPERGETTGVRRTIDNQQFFVRLGQKLINALHQQTADGFVYRVDMRLRPFGDSGPLVTSFAALEDYYQEQGRDWERYAMLKGRLLGHSIYHQDVEAMLRPFVYRRYIDFSVIDSLRRMKAMISQEVRRKGLVNNIKLGAGGIREIEFVVQVFQLIRGGRLTQLQQRHLLTVIPLLVNEQELTAEGGRILTHAYRFLRRVENIIQALADQQSQTLPDNALDQARLLHVLGFNHWAEFSQCLDGHMLAVHQEFLALIGDEDANKTADDQHWVALWQSDWPEDEAVLWIEQHAAHWQGKLIWQTVADFRREMLKRRLGNRGRQILEKLMPLLLWQLQISKAQEVTLARILLVFDKISTRTAYLELLFENVGALKHLIRVCQESQWIAEHIAKYPILLDELIDPSLLYNPPALSAYALELREIMLRIPEEDVEAQMDMLRQFKQAQQLRIAVADIVGALPLMKVSDHLTALAQALMNEVINLAWQQVSVRYGVPKSTIGREDKGFVVIGYGKLGGRELSYNSDLDLVFLHTCPENDLTDGSKQVSAKAFYMKLVQRIMHISNIRMSSGILYELDLRLRPSGNAGLLVIHINAFADYQQEEAWTWEHQALVRARVIYGDEVIVRQFNLIRQQVLSRDRAKDTLLNDVLTMRKKMRDHLDQSTAEGIDLKHGLGGLVDIEFLAQYLVLKNARQYPKITKYSDNIRIFEQLTLAGIMTPLQQSLLTQRYCYLRDQGHRVMLQNKKLLLDEACFHQSANDINEVLAFFFAV